MQRRSTLVSLIIASVVGLALLFGRGGHEDDAQREIQAAAVGHSADTLHAPGVPESVSDFLRNGQAWRAARAMREHLSDTRDAAPEAILLAARAEAGWGGWSRVRKYLEGREWLDVVHGGEGWFWLARALEEDEEWESALDAYRRYLSASASSAPDDRQRTARLRQGLVLLRLGRSDEAARHMESMRVQMPEIAPRLNVVAAEALAPTGDTAGVRRLAGEADQVELRERGRSALVRAYEAAEDPRGALALARSFRGQAPDASGRAAFALQAGRLAQTLGDTDGARAELRAALAESPGSSSARTAAELLAEIGGLTADDRLTIARVLDRHGAHPQAISHYRAWLAAGAGTAAAQSEVRFQLAKALFDAGRYGDVGAALGPLESAEALHLAGRAQYRLGNRSRAEQIFLRNAQRHPRTGPGSESLFIVADLDHDAGRVARARTLFRRVATEFRGTDRAGLSLMRLGGLAYLQKDFAGAAAAWEEYRSTYPSGERWLEATYWAGRAYERSGQRDKAAAHFRAVRERDPLSYYTLQAGERLDQPFWPVAMGSAPGDNAAARTRVEEWMRGVDLLLGAGLHEEAEREADFRIASAGTDATLLYPLAEALNERGLTVRGIRIGNGLRSRAGELNPRLLRILYPFPYRPMIVAEAREKKLDPFLVAALIRQESLFKARISSPVGARGLMQIMPETGRGIARGAGISNWDPELLFQPEINAHLGTTFLADQMRRWDGSLPSVFSAYNAGPHRVERWQSFPEYADEELFTERIPYRETRDYVKILTRNIALYRGLYGDGGT